jgi:transposase-like protein
LDAELQKWRDRPLGQCPYLAIDARGKKVRHDGQLRDCVVLLVLGITASGHRTILGVNVALSEAEAHWRSFFNSPVQSGLCGIALSVAMTIQIWRRTLSGLGGVPLATLSTSSKMPD